MWDFPFRRALLQTNVSTGNPGSRQAEGIVPFTYFSLRTIFLLCQEGSQATGIPNPTTEIRISRHLLETVPAGVEETGRRLSSPGHGQRSKYKSLVYPTVACALSGVVVCGTFLFVALCFRPTYRLGISDRDKLMVSYLLPVFLYERFFYCVLGWLSLP